MLLAMTDLQRILDAGAAAGPTQPQPRVGVSSCLLGEQVRHDGGHKRSRFIADVLSRHVRFDPVCPELAIGLGVPREPIRLQGRPDTPRAVGTRTQELDVTAALDGYGAAQAERLQAISGYLFKSKSPSCGMERVRVYDHNGVPANTGRGIYAAAIMRALPLLPVEEEGRLNDPALRENFLERLYAYQRWQALLANGLSAAALVSFHARHKLMLLAHNREALTALGQRVATAGSESIDELADSYGREFMAALARPAPRAGHTDVLFHLQSYLKRALPGEDRRELAAIIEDYRQQRVPLIVPVTLLRHHFRRYPDPYVAKQLYLTWAPADLGLWNQL